jgi:hypothetical protein
MQIYEPFSVTNAKAETKFCSYRLKYALYRNDFQNWQSEGCQFPVPDTDDGNGDYLSK